MKKMAYKKLSSDFQEVGQIHKFLQKFKISIILYNIFSSRQKLSIEHKITFIWIFFQFSTIYKSLQNS